MNSSLGILWQACPGGARILRVFGDSPCPALPVQIEGFPVVEIGPYCFAQNQRSQPADARFWSVDGRGPAAYLHPIAGDFVQGVTLPAGVRALHNAAFYNCRKLEWLCAGSALESVGSDLFTNCRVLDRFILDAAPDAPTGLKKLVAAVSADIGAVFAPGGAVQAKVFYPEYFEFLDENTSEEVSTEITEETEESIEEDVVWDDELRQLSDDDFGAVNEKVFDYDDPDYIKEGTLKVDYGPDTTGEKEAINVPQGTRFDQYTHSDTGGRYFAEEGADYDSLNLPDVEDKRTLSTYEVVEDGLEVDQSGIAYQPWQDKTGDNGSFQYNFPKMDEYGKRLYGEDGKPLYMSTEELLESGKIRKVEK